MQQEFNSLDAQRESGEAYVKAHKGEGWVVLPDYYDDGGFSGGNTDRPALKRLMADIETGKVDIVVVYKVDRLTRSLGDFAQLVEVLDRQGVSFVSVTQHFNTTDSMGRLTLNILLTFAQFEREVIGERIRDKFALSKKKGKFMGGCVPTGYFVKDRKLHEDEHYGGIIRDLFRMYSETKSLGMTHRLANKKGYRTPTRIRRSGHKTGGAPFSRKVIYYILRNRIYLGDSPHKGQWFEGEHEAIVPRVLWDEVQAIHQADLVKRGRHTRAKTATSPLAGRIFGPDGGFMVPSSTRRNGRCYRYYISNKAVSDGYKKAPVPPISAGTLEEMVLSGMGNLLKAPEYAAQIHALLMKEKNPDYDIPPAQELTQLLSNMGEVWAHLFPDEQKRLFELMVERVEVGMDEILIRYHVHGLTSVVAEASRNQAAKESWL